MIDKLGSPQILPDHFGPMFRHGEIDFDRAERITADDFGFRHLRGIVTVSGPETEVFLQSKFNDIHD